MFGFRVWTLWLTFDILFGVVVSEFIVGDGIVRAEFDGEVKRLIPLVANGLFDGW